MGTVMGTVMSTVMGCLSVLSSVDQVFLPDKALMMVLFT